MIFEQYYAYAEYFVKDENVAEVMVEIQPLKSFFNDVKINQSKKFVQKDEANHFIVKGGNDLILSEKDFNDLKLIVRTIRKQLVEF